MAEITGGTGETFKAFTDFLSASQPDYFYGEMAPGTIDLWEAVWGMKIRTYRSLVPIVISKAAISDTWYDVDVVFQN